MLRRVTFRQLEVTVFVHDRALDYLANRRHTLSEALRYQLTQVVEGYAGRCDEDAPASSGCASNIGRPGRSRC
jgi:hypothetical protein